MDKIKIHHECEPEGGREEFTLRITVCHHKACRAMTNGDKEGHIFLSHPHTQIVDSFSCSPLKTSNCNKNMKRLSEILNRLRCDIHVTWCRHFNITMTSWIEVRTTCSFRVFILTTVRYRVCVWAKKWNPDLVWKNTLSLLVVTSLSAKLFMKHEELSMVYDLFDLILYVPSTIFQLNRDGSSWVVPILS